MAAMVGTSLTDPSLAPALDRDDEDDARTPQGQPEPAPPAATSTDTPESVPDNPLLLGEYTRTRQELAEIVAALGLPKKAKKDDILAALRSRQQADAGDQMQESPELAQMRADIEERGWRYAERLYPGWAEATKQIITKARETTDPDDLVPFFYALVEGLSKTGAEPAPTAGDDEPGHVDIPLGDSDRGPTQRQVQQAAAERGQGSGNVAGAIRDLFTKRGVVKRSETVTYDDE